MRPVPSARKLRKFLRQWRARYPCPSEWADDRANKQFRRSEARWLSQFEGATALKRRQVKALIAWRFAGQPHSHMAALAGIESPNSWGQARRHIKRALDEQSPTGALKLLVDGEDGIPGWDTTMASALLAACRPKTYVVADVRALLALRGLGLWSPLEADRFAESDWWPYLRTCRDLADASGLSLRSVGHALWAASDVAPKLPEPPQRNVRK